LDAAQNADEITPKAAMQVFEAGRLQALAKLVPRRTFRPVLRWLAILWIGVDSLQLLVTRIFRAVSAALP
jgi:hypothetical protein